MSQMLYEWLCCLTFFQPRRLILRVNSRHQTDLKQHEHTIVLLESFRHDRFRVPDGHMDPYMVNSLFLIHEYALNTLLVTQMIHHVYDW